MSSGEDKCDKWDFNSKKAVIPTHTIIAEKDAQIAAARREVDELRIAFDREDGEICQMLGKALGYPWFKDDQKNFPGATEENGVCVGDHVAASIAAEAAKAIARVKREAAELRTLFEAQQAALQAALGREERLRRALNGWQEWWFAPWEAKRPDIAQRRYEAGCAALQKEETVMTDANEREEKS